MAKELEISFNGVVLNDLITPSFSTDSEILPEITYDTSVNSGWDGTRFMRGRRTSRKITIPYKMKNPSEEKRQKLAAILGVDEPAKLILGRAPDRYFLAVPEGGVAGGMVDRFSSKSTITFDCFDPYAHAIDTKSFASTDGSPIAVTYNGTAPALPVVTFTMTGENGYIGLANDTGGALEFGDPEEFDGQTLKKSDRALAWNMTAKPAEATINTGCVTPYKRPAGATVDNSFAGNVLFGRDMNNKVQAGGEFAFPQFTAIADNVWHGPGIHAPVKPNSSGKADGDFKFATRVGFNPNSKTASRMEFTVESGGKPAATIVIRDSSVSGHSKTLESWIGTSLRKSVNLDGRIFTNGGFEFSISRQNGVVSFTCAKIVDVTKNKATNTFTTREDIGNIDGVTIWAEQAGKNPVGNIYWTNLSFQWVNVSYWNDIPNRWSAGDTVTIDMPNRRVLVNDVESDLMTVGNDWDSFAMSKPMTIQPIVSSWASPAKVTVQVREAYL